MKRHSYAWLFGILIFVLVLGGFFYFIDTISKTTENNTTQLLKDRLEAALVDVYATEGYYPASLDSLIEKTSLTYDSDRYMIVYDSFAENIRPRIKIIERKRV